MAHQTGFGGSIKLLVSSTVLQPAGTLGSIESRLAKGHLLSTVNVTIQKWTVDSDMGIVEAFAKREAWVTKFGTVKGWKASVEALMPDTLAVGEFQHLYTSLAAVCTFVINATVASPAVEIDFLSGTGSITECRVETPMDGPVVAFLEILGTGALVPTVA